MNDEPNGTVLEFCTQLARVNRALAELYRTGDPSHFTELNGAVKALHAVESTAKEPVLEAVREECKVIYVNSDLIVKLLRTTEDGVIDKGAQKGLDKFMHNIDSAVVNIAGALGLV